MPTSSWTQLCQTIFPRNLSGSLRDSPLLSDLLFPLFPLPPFYTIARFSLRSLCFSLFFFPSLASRPRCPISSVRQTSNHNSTNRHWPVSCQRSRAPDKHTLALSIRTPPSISLLHAPAIVSDALLLPFTPRALFSITLRTCRPELMASASRWRIPRSALLWWACRPVGRAILHKKVIIWNFVSPSPSPSPSPHPFFPTYLPLPLSSPRSRFPLDSPLALHPRKSTLAYL